MPDAVAVGGVDLESQSLIEDLLRRVDLAQGLHLA